MPNENASGIRIDDTIFWSEAMQNKSRNDRKNENECQSRGRCKGWRCQTRIRPEYASMTPFSKKRGESVEAIKGILKQEALKICNEDIEINKRMGQNGAKLLEDGFTVLTHCNAGALATAGYGTALGVIVVMVLMRDIVRNTYLSPYFKISDLTVNAQYSPLTVFILALVAGMAVIVYMLKLAVRSGKEAKS